MTEHVPTGAPPSGCAPQPFQGGLQAGADAGFDIVAYGEPMVEFNQTGEGGGRLYLQGFGGDSSNFAIAAARQGARVAYLSAVGDDPYGRLLRELWTREGVDHVAVATDAQGPTAVYFVTHDAAGHHFHFFRSGSAAPAQSVTRPPASVTSNCPAAKSHGES